MLKYKKMIKKKKVIIGIISFFLILIGLVFFMNQSSNTNSFVVDNVLVESKIKLGESLENNIRIENVGQDSNFELSLFGLEGLAEVSESNFYLESGNSKTIELFFKDSMLIPGSYLGYLNIKNELDEKKIPIILSIESKIPLFAINLDVAPDDKQLNKGEATKTNLKFFSLSDTKPHTVILNYEIRNIEGKSIISEQNEIMITFSSSITKIIDLPENIEEGDYIFTAILTYEESLTSSSYLFSVDAEKKQNLTTGTLSIFILLFVIIVFILIGYMFYERNKLFSKLKNQQANQIKIYSRQINEQQKKSLVEAKTKEERQRILKEFKEAKKKILNGIRDEQIKQKKEFERIRKKKGNKAVEKKIDNWKRSIYPNAVKRVELSHGLRIKLGVLTRAYDEKYISKKSYTKVKERINKFKEKLKRNIYK